MSKNQGVYTALKSAVVVSCSELMSLCSIKFLDSSYLVIVYLTGIATHVIPFTPFTLPEDEFLQFWGCQPHLQTFEFVCVFSFKITWLSDLCNVLLQLVDLSEEMGMFGCVLFHLF